MEAQAYKLRRLRQEVWGKFQARVIYIADSKPAKTLPQGLKMAQQVQVPAAKADNLSSISSTYLVKEGSQLLKIVLQPLHKHLGTCAHHARFPDLGPIHISTRTVWEFQLPHSMFNSDTCQVSIAFNSHLPSDQQCCVAAIWACLFWSFEGSV